MVQNNQSIVVAKMEIDVDVVGNLMKFSDWNSYPSLTNDDFLHRVILVVKMVRFSVDDDDAFVVVVVVVVEINEEVAVDDDVADDINVDSHELNYYYLL